MVILLFWFATSVLILLALIMSFPKEAVHLALKLRRKLYLLCARKYGVEVADRSCPLYSWELSSWERRYLDQQQQTTSQLLACYWLTLFKIALSPAPIENPRLSRWLIAKMALLGLLIDLGIARLKIR
jgi:hypothetical protein